MEPQNSFAGVKIDKKTEDLITSEPTQEQKEKLEEEYLFTEEDCKFDDNKEYAIFNGKKIKIELSKEAEKELEELKTKIDPTGIMENVRCVDTRYIKKDLPKFDDTITKEEHLKIVERIFQEVEYFNNPSDYATKEDCEEWQRIKDSFMTGKLPTVSRCKWLYADWCHEPEYLKIDIQEKCPYDAVHQDQRLCPTYCKNQ